MAFTKVTLSGAVDTLKEGWTKLNDLIDDLLSTSNGLGASQIGIEDSAGNMAAANVEDALAEIYTDVTSARSLASGLEEDSDTTTGLTWGYNAGTIRLNNVVYSVSASTIGLTDDSVNYVELNTYGVMTKNTTAFTTGYVPIRQITCASGAQTVSTDRRAFLESVALPNDTYLVANNNAGDGVVEAIKVDANDRINAGVAVNTFQFHDGTNTIDFPTNGMAAAKFMLGNSSTVAWFYLNAAPPGWKVLSTGSDTILAVSGGSDAYNANGGTAAGTWTQPNHTHSFSATTGNANQALQFDGGDAQTVTTVEHTHTVSGTSDNGATAATYRPSASIGKLFQLDTA